MFGNPNMISDLKCNISCNGISSTNCFLGRPRDGFCDPAAQPDACAAGTTCQRSNPFDASEGQCLIPCARSALGQTAACPANEKCLRTAVVELQPTETPLSGDFSFPGSGRNGPRCSTGTGTGHDYCEVSTASNPALVICSDLGQGTGPVCLGLCDGGGGPDNSCPDCVALGCA